MRGLPNNPFREACFHDLWVECQNAAGRLEERTFTSREEKEAFAERVKFLVLTLAMRFSTSDTVPSSPEMTMTRSFAPNIEQAFMACHDRLVRDDLARVRVYTLYRAADFVLGKKGPIWVNPGLGAAPRTNPVRQASSSVEGLRDCLRQLHERFEEMKGEKARR